MNYVIVGAGPAGVIAAETIRKLSSVGSVTLIGDEPESPYSRMAIPYLLIGNIEEPGTHLRKCDSYFEDKGIEVIIGKASSVDTEKKILSLSDCSQRSYDKLLVTTGSRPIVPPIPGIDHEKITSCWTLEDARKIIANMKQPGISVVLIGAGFIGCIILQALVASGANLTVIEMSNRIVSRMLDEKCGTLLRKWCTQKGVNVMTSSQVKAIESAGENVEVIISGGRSVEAELVISAAGVRPNADFLSGLGIELVDGAVAIDEYMQSSVADIYAAGDVARGKDFSTGEYRVQAIQPTAVEHARIAASNMVKHGSVKHQGSILMNVLDTMGLISVSYGQWQGVEGGDSSRQLWDDDNFRYIQLQFEGNRLVGANTLGMKQHIGVLRGLIQGRFDLGKWKDRLVENPIQIMEAYLAVTQG